MTRHFLGTFHELVVGYDFIHKADPMGLGRIEGLVRQENLHGIAVAELLS